MGGSNKYLCALFDPVDGILLGNVKQCNIEFIGSVKNRIKEDTFTEYRPSSGSKHKLKSGGSFDLPKVKGYKGKTGIGGYRDDGVSAGGHTDGQCDASDNCECIALRETLEEIFLGVSEESPDEPPKKDEPSPKRSRRTPRQRSKDSSGGCKWDIEAITKMLGVAFVGMFALRVLKICLRRR